MAGKGIRLGVCGLAAIYLLAIHVALFLAIFYPDIIDGQRWRAGWLQVEPSRHVAMSHDMFRAIASDQPPGRLLLIGDSQMQRLDTHLLAVPALNFGIGGDRMASMAARLKDYGYRERAGAVVLWGGVNDILLGGTPEDVAAALGDARAHMPRGTPLYVLAIPPVGGGMESGIADRIAAANRLLAKACRGNCRFIDTTARLATLTGGLDPIYDSGDGLHLNRRGHAQVVAALNPFLIGNRLEPAAS